MAYDIQSILSELNIEVRTDRLVNRQVYHKLSSLWDISPLAASPSNPIPAPLPIPLSLSSLHDQAQECYYQLKSVFFNIKPLGVTNQSLPRAPKCNELFQLTLDTSAA